MKLFTTLLLLFPLFFSIGLATAIPEANDDYGHPPPPPDYGHQPPPKHDCHPKTVTKWKNHWRTKHTTIWKTRTIHKTKTKTETKTVTEPSYPVTVTVWKKKYITTTYTAPCYPATVTKTETEKCYPVTVTTTEWHDKWHTTTAPCPYAQTTTVYKTITAPPYCDKDWCKNHYGGYY